MEYPISVRLAHSDELESLSCSDKFVVDSRDPEIKEYRRFLSNGGKFYPDQQFAEYSTPEELTFDGAVMRELAGERIVIDTLIRYVREFRPDIKEAFIQKRVIDDYGNTWGYHGNLLADRSRIKQVTDEYMHLLGVHIATAQPLIGGGILRPSWLGSKPFYSFGQKVLKMDSDYSTGTTATHKGIINQRDQTLASDDLYRRIHVTSLDPHISPWATKFTLSSMSLVLRAIEQGFGKDLRFADAPGALRSAALQCAMDINFEKKIELAKGDGTRSASIIDIQQELIDIVSRTDHTDEEHDILAEWQRAVEDLAKDPALLVDRSDAIAKLERIREWNVRKGNASDDMATVIAQAVDRQYDQIFSIGQPHNPLDTDTPLDGYWKSHAHRLRRGVMSATMPAEDDIQHAFYEPPHDTRAFGRAQAIKRRVGYMAVDWHEYVVDGVKVKHDDPYIPVLPEHEGIFEK